MRDVQNASATRVGPFPQVNQVLAGWQNQMVFKKVTDSVTEGEVTKTATDYPFQGVFQPMRAQEIYWKGEGQRAWRWWSLWTRVDYDINVNDNIQDFNGRTFKVLKREDWKQAGYTKFDLVEDYQERT